MTDRAVPGPLCNYKQAHSSATTRTRPAAPERRERSGDGLVAAPGPPEGQSRGLSLMLTWWCPRAWTRFYMCHFSKQRLMGISDVHCYHQIYLNRDRTEIKSLSLCVCLSPYSISLPACLHNISTRTYAHKYVKYCECCLRWKMVYYRFNLHFPYYAGSLECFLLFKSHANGIFQHICTLYPFSYWVISFAIICVSYLVY